MDASVIVGLLGLAGSGKGTVADYMVNEFGYEKQSFASPIKDITSTLFGWDRALLEGDTKESREFREKQQGKYIPRDVLQKIGTECFRDAFNPDFWIDALESRVDTSKNIVIADVRFKNEMDWILSKQGKLLWVSRPDKEPQWFSELVNNGTKPETVHSSEWEWTQHYWFQEKQYQKLENIGTLENLHLGIEELVLFFWKPRRTVRRKP
tara:strand:+ start:72 stop:698 length:627 start_codon:yes stop_codon:yes gene_type:complete